MRKEDAMAAEAPAVLGPLVVPEPPSANRYWRSRIARTRLGRQYVQVYVSPLARQWRVGLKWAAARAGWKPLEGPVRLKVRWCRARKAGDLSNRVKVLEDALQGLGYRNDAQVCALDVAAVSVSKGHHLAGKVVVWVERVEEPGEDLQLVWLT